MGNTRNTGYLQNIVLYDENDNITLPARLAVTGTVSVNNTTPYDTTQFSLDVNGGLIVKNINKTAQFVLINSNPATGGNNAFVVHTVGGTSASSYADIQGYYGTSIAGSTVLRLNPQGGNVLVGSLAGTGNRMVVASATGVLSTQAIVTLGDLSGVSTARALTINGTTYDLSADRTWTLYTDNISEDASPVNLWFTNARARAAISVTGSGSYDSATGVITVTGGVTSVNTLTGAVTLTTSNISEGTNLYYTQTRFNTAFSGKSTSDLSEGTNLYYTDTRVGTYLTNNNYATQTYVGTAISNLVDAAPGTLDTLNELAAALGDDPNFATSVATSIGTKEPVISAGTTLQYWRGDKTWQTLPIYTLSGLGGVPTTRTITINGTALDLSADRSFTINSMVYPGAGIAVSTGSAWGTSITDNSSNWNTAYGWGNHASAGYLTTSSAASTYVSLSGSYANPSWITSLAYSKITGVPAFLTSYTETDTLQSVILRNGTTNTGFTITNTNDTYSTPGNTNVPVIYLYNTGTTSTANAVLSLRTNSGTGGDPILSFDIGGVQGWSMGIDNSDSDKFKIARSWAALDSDTRFSMAVDGTAAFTGNLTAANLSGTNTGDQTNISGNAGTVTNGVYTTGSYANPAWITSLAYSKITGVPAFITSYTETDTLASVTGRGATTTAAITTGGLTVNTGGSGTWGQFVVNSTSLWGDGATLYTTIGAGGAAGVMLFNPHVVWNSGSSCAGIRIGRSGGTSSGKYYEIGTGASDNFFIAKEGLASGTQLNINSSGNATFSGTITASNFSGSSSGTNTGDQTNISGNAATATYATSAGSSHGIGYDGNAISGMGPISTWDSRPGVGMAGFGISWHTGVSISGYPGYGGVRLYSAGYPTHASSVLRLEASTAVYTYGGLYSDGNAVIHAGNISSQPVVTIQDAPPSGSAGRLWWESDTGKLKVYYGSAWVDASPVPDSSLFFAKAGGSITGDVTVGQTLNVVGNTLVQGNINAFGDITAYSSSDARLKDNITVIESPLEKLSKINGVSFNWNDKQTAYEVGKKDIGVIAQEIEEVLPELVTTRDNGYKAVRYEKIVALLIEAVKEQQTQINNLTDKLNNL